MFSTNSIFHRLKPSASPAPAAEKTIELVIHSPSNPSSPLLELFDDHVAKAFAGIYRSGLSRRSPSARAAAIDLILKSILDNDKVLSALHKNPLLFLNLLNDLYHLYAGKNPRPLTVESLPELQKAWHFIVNLKNEADLEIAPSLAKRRFFLKRVLPELISLHIDAFRNSLIQALIRDLKTTQDLLQTSIEDLRDHSYLRAGALPALNLPVEMMAQLKPYYRVLTKKELQQAQNAAEMTELKFALGTVANNLVLPGAAYFTFYSLLHSLLPLPLGPVVAGYLLILGAGVFATTLQFSERETSLREGSYAYNELQENLKLKAKQEKAQELAKEKTFTQLRAEIAAKGKKPQELSENKSERKDDQEQKLRIETNFGSNSQEHSSLFSPRFSPVLAAPPLEIMCEEEEVPSFKV